MPTSVEPNRVCLGAPDELDDRVAEWSPEPAFDRRSSARPAEPARSPAREGHRGRPVNVAARPEPSSSNASSRSLLSRRRPPVRAHISVATSKAPMAAVASSSRVSSFLAAGGPGGQFHRERRPPTVALLQQPPTQRRCLCDHAVQLEEGRRAFFQLGRRNTERVRATPSKAVRRRVARAAPPRPRRRGCRMPRRRCPPWSRTGGTAFGATRRRPRRARPRSPRRSRVLRTEQAPDR